MKNLKNLAAFVATAALATAAMAQNVDNWRSASGETWKSVRAFAGAMPLGRQQQLPKIVMAH